MSDSDKTKKVLSGTRPSGKLHIGHLHGALKNWVDMQEEYDCFYFVADWHALTTEFNNTSVIREAMYDMVADWLATGLDPEKSTIFVQSQVKEHAEFAVLLGMVTPLSWVERCPTYKEVQEQTGRKDLSTYGFLGYPVLQSADILVYRANYVPVGQDQVPHVELTRDIARRFNNFYGDVIPVPEAILTKASKVPGLDGRKMSKSYNNAIYLSDTPEEIEKKIKPMVTCEHRKRRSDPGHPEHCPVFGLHLIYTGEEKREELDEGCRTAGIGCIDCKNVLIPAVIEELTPIREKRAALKTETIEQVLEAGNEKARKEAGATMQIVRAKMGLPVK